MVTPTPKRNRATSTVKECRCPALGYHTSYPNRVLPNNLLKLECFNQTCLASLFEFTISFHNICTSSVGCGKACELIYQVAIFPQGNFRVMRCPVHPICLGRVAVEGLICLGHSPCVTFSLQWHFILGICFSFAIGFATCLLWLLHGY